VTNFTTPIGLLRDLTRTRAARSAWASSFDQSGGDQDHWMIMPRKERQTGVDAWEEGNRVQARDIRARFDREEQ
jgi:hypothetical protein